MLSSGDGPQIGCESGAAAAATASLPASDTRARRALQKRSEASDKG